MAYGGSKIDFTNGFEDADIILKVEGRPIYANKTCLSMWSPVFRAMFTLDFKEKSASEIELPGKHYESMLRLMEVVHPPCREINEKNVRLLIPLADEYQIETIKHRCEKFLESHASLNDYDLAVTYNMNELKDEILYNCKNKPVKDLLQEIKLIHNSKDDMILAQTLLLRCSNCEAKIEELQKDLRKQSHWLSKEESTFCCKVDSSEILGTEPYFSPHFVLHNITWYISLQIKCGKLSMYLHVRTDELNSDWSFNAKYIFTIIRKSKVKKEHIIRDSALFNSGTASAWGYADFISVAKLLDPANGFLDNGCIVFQVTIAACGPV